MKRPAHVRASPGPLGRLAVLGRGTLRAYLDDNVSRLGAALAFYTTVAVAPLLMLAIMAAGVLFRHDVAREQVLNEIRQLVGTQASRALEAVEIPPQHDPTAATWISLAIFAIGGFGVFAHLQDALNVIWRAPKAPDQSWPAVLKRRLFSFGTVVATGFIMLVSLIVSAGLGWVGAHASQWAAWPAGLWQTVNFILSLGVIAFLFAVIFKMLPDVPVRWRDVWTGAGLTALLFMAGKSILGVYLAHARITSSYGAAGSLIALLLWSYYAAQILFIGAEFTRVHASTRGGRAPLD